MTHQKIYRGPVFEMARRRQIVPPRGRNRIGSAGRGTLIDWEGEMVEALKSLTVRVKRPLTRDHILEAHALHESSQTSKAHWMATVFRDASHIRACGSAWMVDGQSRRHTVRSCREREELPW